MTKSKHTIWIQLTCTLFIMFLCEFFIKPALSADREEAVRWRHEGLMIDNRDAAFIKAHLEQEPWKSAWEKLQGDESLLGLVVRRQFSGDEGLDKKIVQRVELKPSVLYEYEPRFFKNALAYELLRENETVGKEFLNQCREWIYKNPEPTSSKFSNYTYGLIEIVKGVVLEDEKAIQVGEDLLISALQHKVNNEGIIIEHDQASHNIKEEFESDIINISCLLVMAEINAHHGDIFFGNDLYHYAIGHKNLHQICSALFKRIQEEKANPEHWGWLELAYKTYGDPEWLPELEKRRPIFDEWVGGPVTLTHGRVYSTQPPDFGIAEDGFHWLYNFKDLSGWQMSARWYDIDPNDFFVEDGVIHTKGARDHWLMTDRMYDRFHLKLEYRIGQGSNSGILLWAPVPGRPSMCGFEVQLMDDAGKEPSKSGSGALYEVFAPTINAQKPAGEWNTMEIICSDPRLRVILNETLVQDINLNDDSKTRGRRRRGFIGLQDHAHKVAFRNVRVKVITAGTSDE